MQANYGLWNTVVAFFDDLELKGYSLSELLVCRPHGRLPLEEQALNQGRRDLTNTLMLRAVRQHASNTLSDGDSDEDKEPPLKKHKAHTKD